MLNPQNGDRIVVVDSVTSRHPVYINNHVTTVGCVRLAKQSTTDRFTRVSV